MASMNMNYWTTILAAGLWNSHIISSHRDSSHPHGSFVCGISNFSRGRRMTLVYIRELMA